MKPSTAQNHTQQLPPASNPPSSQPPTAPPLSFKQQIKPDWPMPQLQNIAATANLDCRLDLGVIAQQARNVEYNRKRFHAVIMRIRHPRTTALIFASGRMVITGNKSEADARLAARRYAHAVRKCGYPRAAVRDLAMQNFVASVACGFPVRLEGLAAGYHVFCRHEPELFPALVYTMLAPKMKCLVFTNGKVVFTGAKAEEHVYEAMLQLYPLLQKYQVERVRAEPAAPQRGYRKRRTGE